MVENKNVGSKVTLQEYKLAIDEVEAVLGNKKPMTDATKAAQKTISKYVKERAADVREKGKTIRRQIRERKEKG